VRLADTSVFLDFDGTITRRDSCVHVLERLGGPDWATFSDAFSAGRIGSRECIQQEWGLVRSAGEETLRAVAAEVAVDPTFGALADALRAAGAEVAVVSDGFGYYAEEVCAAAGVPVITNAVDWSTGELTFPNLDRCCPCSTCGTCKQAPIKDARRRGRTAVFVGDGISDRKAALLADVLFAKDNLADWCEDAGVDYRPFATLADVARALGLGLAS
jgi:2-hydroxy-3-keto-5-methylthiopentenyl-1-phosphate phosphatase